MRPAALFVVSALLLVVWLGLSAAATLYFYEAWEARFTVREQAVTLRLPAGMKALAEVDSPLRTHVDVRPRLVLHIDQPVEVQLRDALVAHAQVKTTLPIDTAIDIDTVMPVRTLLDTTVSVRSWLPRVAVKLPLTLDLPVRMKVPVKTEVPVELDIDVSGQLPERLTVPVRGDFALRPHVRGAVDVSMKSQTRFSLTDSLFLPDLRIVRADVRLPMNLGFHHQP